VAAVQNNAEQAVREMLRTLSEEHGLDPVDHLYAEDFMDVFDFAGTGHEIYGTWPRRRSQVSRVVLTRVVCGACRVCRARAKVT
jgi:hypothetical protein